MSKELADKVGLVEGEKAIFVSEICGVRRLKAVTVDRVVEGDIGDFRVYCEEFAGCVLPRDLYSREKIMKMLGVKAEHDYSDNEIVLLVATGMIIGVALISTLYIGVMIATML